jgi:hypothetical protein
MMPPHSNNPLPYQEKEGKISALLSEELVRGGCVEGVDEVGEHEGDDHQQVRDALVNRRAVAGGRRRGGLRGGEGRHGDGEDERRHDGETERSGSCHGGW